MAAGLKSGWSTRRYPQVPAWARLIELRSTLEALAFAAAAALLGTVVQRQAVAGETRSRDELLSARETELERMGTALAACQSDLKSLRAGALAAARLLTVDAPGDATLGQLEPLPARGSAALMRQARQALIEGLRTATPSRR